jgi:N-methylhydantoinase B
VYQRGGGGGWGDALDREPDKVRDDVLDEYVSREAAERDYGVVFTGSVDDYTLAVDVSKTNALRKKMRGASRG